MDVIKLTQELIKFKTINPPGNEKEIALYLGNLLKENGFKVSYPELDKNRLHLIAEKRVNNNNNPIILSGHLDVVPLGKEKWRKDPFAGNIESGKLYGRGSTDMKSGVAAMVCAAINVFKEHKVKNSIKIILTASEENGCFGATDLKAKNIDIGKAIGLIVAEPTSNIPLTGHKGGLYINAYTKGITAHASMPQHGDNAIYKAARAIVKLENMALNAKKDSLLGFPTLNIGTFKGGVNSNSVPDRAEFTIDIRTTRMFTNQMALDLVKNTINNEVIIKPFVNLGACYTDESSTFVQNVYNICKQEGIKAKLPASAPYLTDASILQSWYNGVPTIIIGPGEPEMAHKTNEYCFIDKIYQAENIYKKILIGTEDIND